MKKKICDLNLALLGCGSWGNNLARNFKELGVLRCICDKNKAQAERISKIYGVKKSSYKQIIESSSIDAVIIATPAKTHFKIAFDALNSDKHVFVEKPMSLKKDEGKKLVKISKKKKKF